MSIRKEIAEQGFAKETFCCVKKGGIMFMKPLLLHGSNRTTNNATRKVLHIEFSNTTLPKPLRWSEFSKIPSL